jgi:pimeloyl-ACP methyl ester carboxylesterase
MSARIVSHEFSEAEARVFATWSLTPRVRSLQLQAPEIKLRVVDVGEGEPTLFLHGFSLCPAHFAPLMARLPSRRSIAIDMPGHGGSESIDYTGIDLRSWFRQMLVSCLDELGIESAHIVGHSQGAMFGMWLAVDAPERVRSLVAIGTPAVALGNQIDGLRFLARPRTGQLFLGMPKTRRMYRDVLVRTIGPNGVAAASEDLIRATYLGTQRSGFGSTVSTYLREMFRGVDARPQRYALRDDELAAIRPQVLIVWGRDDKSVPTIAELKQRSTLIPNGRFEVVPGGHEPWLEDLESTAAQIAPFPAAVESGAATPRLVGGVRRT